MAKRREVLVGIGATVAVAGCTGESDDDSDDSELEDEPEVEEEFEDEPTAEDEPEIEDESEDDESEGEPAELVFADISPDNEAFEQGDDVEIVGVVENIGDMEGDASIEILFNGSVVDTENTTLSGGEESAVSYVLDTSDVDPGDYSYGFSIDDDSISAEISILQPAEFRFVEITPGDQTVEYGDEVAVSVTVENTGETDGEIALEYQVDGESIDDDVYAVESGDEITINASIQTLLRDASDYEYGFFTEDDNITATLSVTLDEPDTISFSGSGAEVTDTFDIEGGMTVSEWNHDGDRNFIVNLVDSSGDERDQLLANEIGSADGVWGDGIPEGEYMLDVDADGSWEIDIIQPRATLQDGEEVPFSVSGDESGDWFVLNNDETIEISASHSGDGNFIVSSYEIDGERHLDTLVFNEIGEFDGQTTFSYDLTSFFVIEADGEWELEFDTI